MTVGIWDMGSQGDTKLKAEAIKFKKICVSASTGEFHSVLVLILILSNSLIFKSFCFRDLEVCNELSFTGFDFVCSEHALLNYCPWLGQFECPKSPLSLSCSPFFIQINLKSIFKLNSIIRQCVKSPACILKYKNISQLTILRYCISGNVFIKCISKCSLS